MSYTIRCHLLFDITQTGVTSRYRPRPDEDLQQWKVRRDTQCNLDTVIQAISLRSQPENISTPTCTHGALDENFGFLLRSEAEDVPCWTFTFEVSHSDVFNDGISELGALYSDCDLVPMIKCGTEWEKIPNFLDSSDELRNIYFEVIHGK